MSSARIGALRVDLGMNTAAFEAGVTLAERKMNAFAGKMQKIGGKMQSIGKAMTIGITAPLALFGTKSAQAAIDAQEMESAFDVVFGNMSDSVRQWADETGKAMGRSGTKLQETAMQFQEFFGKAADPKKSVELSKTFAVLTRDLASFKNLSDEVAQQKLLSGLSGEAEPLRAVGVFLSAAKVEAEAVAMGLEKVNGKFTEEQKILARASVIRKELAKANGDVIRTSESTANQIKKAQDAFYELQLVVGTKLIPVLTPLITKLASALEWFSQLPDPVQNGTIVVAGLAAALGPLLSVMGSLVTLAPTLMKAMSFLFAHPVILGAAAVIAGIYLAWKNWDKITAIVRNLYVGVKTWLQDKLGAVFNWVKGKIEAVGGWFYDLYDKVVGNSYIPDMVDEIGHHMRRLDELMVDPAQRATEKTAEKFRRLAGEVRAVMDQLFPEYQRLNAMRDQLATIEEGQKTKGPDGKPLLSGAQAEAAFLRARRQAAGLDLKGPNARVSDDLLNTPSLVEGMEKVGTKLKGLADQSKTQTVRIAKSFKDMAQETMNALKSMVDAIKGGDFLDILSSVVNMVLQLGSAGVFGKKFQAGINSDYGGARAAGGPVSMGKTYLVGERGPELFAPGSSGRIIPNHELGSGGGIAQIVPSPYFDVVVDGRIVRAAPSMIGAAAGAGVNRMQRMNDRRLA